MYPNNGQQGDCDYGNFFLDYGYNQTKYNYDPVAYTGPSRMKRVTVTVETALSGNYTV